jgi:hypothetical protein
MVGAGPAADGYLAARYGFGPEHSPWTPGTVGAAAWSLGHAVGSLPASVRLACRILARVLARWQ